MEKLNIYFAGSLFNHKDLIGNYHLAQAIELASDNRLICVLPQNLEQADSRAIKIRNQDLVKVIECDLTLFNFDGTELDSGTVVEFMLAKMLDIPALILRTDFRSSGDQNKDGEPWNLMCSGYPRTKVILTNGMADYQNALTRSESANNLIENLYSPLAKEIVGSFSELRAQPSLFKGNLDHAKAIYEWAIQFPGGGLTVPANWCEEIVLRKSKAGLI